MAFFRGGLIIVALLCFQPASSVRLTVNPIRRVVNLLQQMQAKVEADGEKEKELYDKFMCYCKNGAGELQKQIAAAEEKIPQLEAEIEELGAQTKQDIADVEKAKVDREEAKQAMAEAKALREKQAATFAKDTADMSANVAAMEKAIAALEKGSGVAFLQSTASSRLRQLSINMELSAVDRDVLSSFLAGGSSDEYVPQSGEIIGILKQMHETMGKDLEEATEAEEESKADYESMMAAKGKEIETLTGQIEAKLARSGEAGVQLVNAKDDLEDTKVSLEEDKKFLADLETNCASKASEWDERCKVRAQEILAIAETIKILNDDDALDLFKKTLPSPSLLQMTVSSKDVRRQAAAALKGHHRLNLISLALQGKKMSFDKVIAMIDDMVALLAKETKDDLLKKETCETNLDEAEDSLKELEYKVSDLGKATDAAKETVAVLTEEIAALEEGIKSLDKQVAEATEIRKSEHTEYVEDLAANNAAIQLLGVAKNRLNKFYNPKLYKPPPKQELTAEESVYSAFGGEVTTPPPGGIANTGISALQDAPPPPPETFGAYTKKGEESQGVTQMIDILVADLEKEVQEMEVDEKHAQGQYEEFMQDSSAKRAADAKSITDDEAAKAELQATLEKLASETTSRKKEAMATVEEIGDLHADCDWLLKNFDVRKNARAAETESLQNAKAVLSGADYS